MGGTDDASNLVSLTTEEHAMAHKKLYEEYGLWEDWLAWQGLAGIMGKDEIIKECHKRKGPAISAAKLGKKIAPKTEEHKRKISESNKGKHYGPHEPTSEATRKKISEALKGRKFTDEHRRNLSLSKKRQRPPLSSSPNAG